MARNIGSLTEEQKVSVRSAGIMENVAGVNKIALLNSETNIRTLKRKNFTQMK